MKERNVSVTRRRQAANLSLDAALKAAALSFCTDSGISLSELTGNFLERKLIEAGYLEKTDTGFHAVKRTLKAKGGGK